MNEEYLKQNLLRQKVYLYLSNSYAYPENDLIMSVLSGEFADDLQKVFLGLNVPAFNSGWFKEYSGRSADKVKNVLRTEYTRLFINTAGSSLLVPPYESCYRNKQGLVMDQPIISDLNRFYKLCGLYLPDYTEALPDHIAVELEFMNYLLEREYLFWENSDSSSAQTILDLENDFLAQHMLIWIPKMTAQIKEHTNISFYRGIADVTDLFLSEEIRYMEWGKEIVKEREV